MYTWKLECSTQLTQRFDLKVNNLLHFFVPMALLLHYPILKGGFGFCLHMEHWRVSTKVKLFQILVILLGVYLKTNLEWSKPASFFNVLVSISEFRLDTKP